MKYIYMVATYTAIQPFPEPAFADMMQWGCDAMRPDKLVNIEAFVTRVYGVFVRYFLLDHKHLQFYVQTRGCEYWRNGTTWHMSATLNICLLSKVF